MEHNLLFNEVQLDAVADQKYFPGVLPELLFRLIAASVNDPGNLRIPFKGGEGQPGFDGIVVAPHAYKHFVPAGQSLWEFGSGNDPAAKATEDFTKRTAQLGEADKKECVFVFVTPRSATRGWTEGDQKKWIEKRRDQGWKNIVVLDATQIIQWLYFFPEIDFWLAGECGFSTSGLNVPSLHWKTLESYGEPPKLNYQLFLKNRQDAVEKVLDVFRGTTNELKIESLYPDDAIDFVVAVLASLDPLEQATYAGKCLIIDDPNTWKKYCSLQTPHVFLARSKLDLASTGHELKQQAKSYSRHGIIFPGTPTGGVHGNLIRLREFRPYELKELLIGCGYDEEKARSVSNRCNGQLAILKRLLSDVAASPVWASDSDSAKLARAALIGQWRGDLESDQRIVEGTVGKPYGEWIDMVRPVTLRPDPPLIQRDEKWKFISRYEGWKFLGHYLSNDDLDRFKTFAIQVLNEINPSLELDSEDRWLANTKGKALKYSSQLREGIAETLVLLSTYPDALSSCSIGRADSTAAIVVQTILSEGGWKKWASLNGILPSLAEASPEMFLAAVTRELDSGASPFAELYNQEGSGISGTNYMTGLLWGLEMLAWNPDYLIPVTLILGKLAEIDPGGRWTNRPSNSLTCIFLPWFPQTTAPIQKRKAALELLLQNCPVTAWKVLLSLMPDTHQATSGSYKPSWREWIPEDHPQEVTNLDYWKQVEAYASLTIEAAGRDYEKLTELISALDRVPPKFRTQLLEQLVDPTTLSLDENKRTKLWECLRNLISKHTKFADADWALDKATIDEISSVADKLAPNDPFSKNQHLFNGRDFDHYEEKGNYELQMKKLADIRQQAVEEVFSLGGVRKVLDFVQAVDEPWNVGLALGAFDELQAQKELLPSLLESTDTKISQFNAGYVWARFARSGWAWADTVVKDDWTSVQTGIFLTLLPFVKDAWQRADDWLGENAFEYWKRTSANAYSTADSQDLAMAIPKLLEAKRVGVALHCAHRLLYEKKSFDPSLAFTLLEEILKAQSLGSSMDKHECIEIIRWLQNNPGTDVKKLQQVEWAYLPILDRFSGGRAVTLQRQLATDPVFFCDLIRTIFRSKKDDKDAVTVPTESDKMMGRNAYRLLREWSFIPGLGEDGTINGAALNGWLDAVKESCKESGHLEVALSQIGNVLSHYPPDADGTWICHPVAKVLDAQDAGDMRHGFVIAILNRRGVHGFSAGKDERNIAKGFREQAEAIEALYPQLASAMLSVSKRYEQDAEREEHRDPFDD